VNVKDLIKKIACTVIICCSLFTSAFFSMSILKDTIVYADETISIPQTTTFSLPDDGVSLYVIKISSTENPVIAPRIGTDSDYFPSNYTVTKNGYGAQTDEQKNIFEVNSGDTIFLADNEFLLLAFGRKGLIDDEAKFNSISNVGGACNVTHFVDGNSSFVNARKQSPSVDESNYLYEYGHIFNKDDAGFVEGFHEFVFDYGTISDGGEVVLGNSRTFNFYLFEKDTYNKNNAKNVVLTPNSGFTTESVQSFVSNDSSFYTENLFNYSNKSMDINKINYPKFVFDPTRVQVSIEKTFNKETKNVTIDSSYTNGTVYSHQTPVDSKIVWVSRLVAQNLTQIEFYDIGEYTISYQYIYYNASHIKQVLPNLTLSFLKDKITVFGYQLFYSKDYTGKAELRKIIENEETEAAETESSSYAADVTYAISQKYSDNAVLFKDAIDGFDKSKVVTTNQSPLKYDFAGTLDLTKSHYWKMNQWSDYGNIYNSPTLYSGGNFLSPGKYVVELYYTYAKYKNPATKDYEASTIHRQLFIFEITNAMPVVTVETLKTENGVLLTDINGDYIADEILQDGEYTNQPVRIVYPTVNYFDSSIQIYMNQTQSQLPLLTKVSEEFGPITITSSNSETYEYSDPINIIDGQYLSVSLTVKFGKSYSSSSVKSFTIDKVGISNLKTALINSQRVKEQYLDSENFVLNQSFSLEWDEKLSGSKTWCTYKFIPLSTDSNYLKTSPVLPGTEKVVISNGRYLDYSTTTGSVVILAESPYANTVNSKYSVTANSVLAIEGIYIFRIYDQAGNECYYYKFLDKSCPVFLQKDENGIYSEPKELNIVSNTTTVEWGTHKGIAFGLFNSESWTTYNNLSSNDIDPWVLMFQKSIYESGYISTTSLNNSEDVSVLVDFLSLPITGVRVFKKNFEGTIELGTYNQSNMQSGYTANALDENGDENEAYYSFFVIDQSNISANLTGVSTSVFFETSLNDLNKKSSSIFNLKTTTDMALSTVLVSDGVSINGWLLDIEGGTADKIDYTEKHIFYKASNSNQLIFSFEDYIGNYISVKVKYLFYPMIFNEINKTYEFSTSGVEISSIEIDSAGLVEQGKYVIERTYETTDSSQLSQVDLEAYIISKKDYLKRIFTVYIDHNDLITTPVAFESSIKPIKLVGDYWELTATDSTFENGIVPFSDFFRQGTNYDPIVVTNKNPVNVKIPYSMYGKTTTEGFVSGMYHNYTGNPEISEYLLDVKLYKIVTNDYGIKVPEIIETGILTYNKVTGNLVVNVTKIGSTNFITFDEETYFWNINIPIGNSYIGTYMVVVSNSLGESRVSNTSLEADNGSTYFVFEIVSPEPKISFSTIIPYPSGDEVGSINFLNIDNKVVGYTNGKCIVASWTDPVENFMIKIDTNNITYTVNDGERLSGYLTTTGNTHTFTAVKRNSSNQEINLVDKDKVIIYFGVVGRTENEYVYIREFHIDTVAPTTNLENLIGEDNLIEASTQKDKEDILRVYGDRYNRSNAEGLFKYYSFAIDIESSFVFEKGSLGDTSRIYFKEFQNKYTDILHEKALPGDPSQTNQSNRFMPLNFNYIQSTANLKTMFGSVGLNGTYYEIVEADEAGNYTIYSIYLYSSLLSNNYINSSSITNSTINVSAENSSDRVIRAIDNLQLIEINMCQDEWFSFSLLGRKYYTSPFIKEYRAGSFAYINSNNEMVYQTLAEISAELVPSATNYSLIVRSRQIDETNVVISLIEGTRYFSTTIQETVENNTNKLVLTVLKNDLNSDPNGQLGLTKIKITVNNGVNSIVQTVNFTLTEEWKITINNAVPNVMYAFELYDNFRGSTVVQSSVRHIYGSESLANPPFEMSDGSNDYLYNAETKTILSAKAINFLFIEAYLKEGKRVKINEDDEGSLDAIVPETADAIKRVTLLPSNEINGALKKYLITVEYYGDLEETIYTVYILNKYSEVYLRDDAGNDKSDLFRGSVTTDPVVVTFISSTALITGAAANLFETKLFYTINDVTQLLTNRTRFSEIGTYSIKYQILAGNKVLSQKTESFTISKEGISTFEVKVQRGSEYETLKSCGNYEYRDQWIPEYISNASVYKIFLNSNLFLQSTVLYTNAEGSTKGTYVIKISNKDSAQKPSIYFETIIAITLIEETQNILTNTQNLGTTTFSYSVNGAASTPVITSDIGSYRLITSTDSTSTGITITWPKWFGTENNKVLLTLKLNGQVILMDDNSGSIKISTSGQYVFSFVDIAGNTHYFTYRQAGTYVVSNEYTIHYLASVVFLVRKESALEGTTGIQNAVYNESVAISIPKATVSIYYDVTAKPVIHVERNGVALTVAQVNDEWLLSEPGLYKVWFTAKKNSLWLPEVPLYFTIINSNESRWAFEFLEYENYVVTELTKNGVDILGNFRVNPNDSSEKVRGFVLSYFDTVKSGKGRYTVTIHNTLVTSFSFSLWINDGEIPIVVSVSEGTSTTKAVSVQFNMQNIYNNIGDCYVKISKQNAIEINAQSLAESISLIRDISLSDSGEYYIQVFTAGGSLMYSYRIEIREPLNTISIVLIVVGSLTLVSLIFIFVKLRKRMQVK